jgi:hypothetical protein
MNSYAITRRENVVNLVTHFVMAEDEADALEKLNRGMYEDSVVLETEYVSVAIEEVVIEDDDF